LDSVDCYAGSQLCLDSASLQRLDVLEENDFYQKNEQKVVAEDDSASAMTPGLAFPIVYPLFSALQACADINA